MWHVDYIHYNPVNTAIANGTRIGLIRHFIVTLQQVLIFRIGAVVNGNPYP